MITTYRVVRLSLTAAAFNAMSAGFRDGLLAGVRAARPNENLRIESSDGVRLVERCP